MGSRRLRRVVSLDAALFAGALGVFLATRLVGLTSFPIYFFADEAIPTLTAADFVHRGFRGLDGSLFPTYFLSGGHYSLSILSVLVQLPGWAAFGFSAYATRATSVVIALIGTSAVSFILRDVFRVRPWWTGVLLLAATPAWFLHTRTAFEVVLAVSLYAWFLYFYLRYLEGRERDLLVALAFAALAFYAYRAIQPVVLLTMALLVAVNLRRHLRAPRHLIAALILVAVLAVPLARFELAHGGESGERLRALGSYWARDEPLHAKLGEFASEYRTGLNPVYWYSPRDQVDLVRHKMRGYGNILLLTLPFAILGTAICVRRIRSGSHRSILIAALAAPAGGAVAGVAITRVLVFVVPAAVLTGLGLAALVSIAARRIRYAAVAAATFATLAGASCFMLVDSLENGPRWYRDYGLYGLQYGAPRIFHDIEAYLRAHPSAHVLLSPNWANGTDELLRFFAPDVPRLKLDTIESFRATRRELPPGTVFVVPRNEYADALGDRLFAQVRVERTVSYPDGTPGFYFVRLKYSAEADEVFAAEERKRRRLVVDSAVVDGMPVRVRHTTFDIGQAASLFDGNTGTLARTAGANPAVVELTFAHPRGLSAIRLTTGSMRFALSALVTGARSDRRFAFTRRYSDLPPDPTVTVRLPRPLLARRVFLRVENLDGDDRTNVHLREIELQP